MSKILDILEDVVKIRHIRWYLMMYRAPKSVRKESLERIRSYKDKYKGERCFVIGNGPSLSTGDLEKIKGEYSFATNHIYQIYEKTSWRPTFFVVKITER